MWFTKITRPSVFQGNLRKKNYFEGWYFKLVSPWGNYVLSIIPGISLSAESHSFIQVIDGNTGLSDYFTFPLNLFQFSTKTFSITIGGNQFSDKGLSLNIDSERLKLKGSISFKNRIQWKGNLISPGIMGWYSWMPFMECYHGVVSLDQTLEGSLFVNEKNIDFSGGSGYTEKDWGNSFPECWVWLQANCFDTPGTSFMISIAKVPWLGRFFIGHLCFLLYSGKVYKFMTWNGTRVVKLTNNEESIMIMLSGREASLKIAVTKTISGQIKAPVQGSMVRYIKESVNATVTVQLTDSENKSIYKGSSPHASLEVVGDIFSYFD